METQDQGSGTTPRSEPYTVEELGAAARAISTAAGVFGPHEREASIYLLVESNAGVEKAGSWMTGILIGVAMAEARHEGR